jgi:membrane protein DedA with SNARE-associated domain
MHSWISNLAAHGFVILFAAVFLEAIGLPVPAALALLIAGGASARGALPASYALPGAIAAMLVGDTLMFLIGRYTGWWLLGLLCRISLNPESCILRSADSFYRRGRKLLLIAKFIPGINTMAPPLAGSMNMRFLQFIRLDLVGATLYIVAYFSVGFVFSGALEAITKGYQAFGRVLRLGGHRVDRRLHRVAMLALDQGAQAAHCFFCRRFRRGARNDRRGTYIRCSQPRLSRPQGDAHHRIPTVGPQHSSSIQ